MSERIYSEALYGAISGGIKLDAALSRLKEVLKDRGHQALYAKILKQTEARLKKDMGAHTLEVIFARQSDEKAYKDEIMKIREALGATHTTIRIDETIAGGYIARTRGKEIDASHKKSLLSIYRSLIN
jgi:F0F1-type ATP synthase delta subunit